MCSNKVDFMALCDNALYRRTENGIDCVVLQVSHSYTFYYSVHT